MHKTKRNRGQIAIITLFALSVFVIIGGSVITQVIFEQRKAVIEQKSKEAYYAAESGIENALESIIAGEEVTITPLTIGTAEVELGASSLGSSTSFTVPTQMFPGEQFYLNLNDYANSGVRLCWDQPEASLIIMYFYTSGASYLSNTYAFNSQGSANLVGGVASETPTSGVCGLSGSNYYSDLTLPAGTPDFLAVWVAYAESMQVAFASDDGSSLLPAQGTTITSTASVTEGENQVNRQVKYFVSSVSGGAAINYPPNFLLVPLYAVGGVTY